MQTLNWVKLAVTHMSNVRTSLLYLTNNDCYMSLGSIFRQDIS